MSYFIGEISEFFKINKVTLQNSAKDRNFLGQDLSLKAKRGFLEEIKPSVLVPALGHKKTAFF